MIDTEVIQRMLRSLSKQPSVQQTTSTEVLMLELGGHVRVDVTVTYYPPLLAGPKPCPDAACVKAAHSDPDHEDANGGTWWS